MNYYEKDQDKNRENPSISDEVASVSSEMDGRC